MGVLIDEVGNKYGRLVVIERNGQTNGGDAKWLCQCECGKRTSVIGSLLRRGSTKSCGCFRIESIANATAAWKLPKGEAAFNWIFDDFRRRANRKKMEWKLTKTEVMQIINQPCFYCGVEFSNHFGEKHGFNGGVKYNGLDRVDNKLGYLPDNVVPCCRSCNIAKNDRESEVFAKWISDVYHNWVIKDRD